MKHERAMKCRQFLKGTFGAASLVALAGCDNLTQSSWFPSILNKTEKLTERVQRAVTPAHALAKELWRCRHFDGVSGEREYRSWHGILCRTRGETILQMDGGGWWPGSDPDELVARGLEGIALADTGHPP
jgi:hypothetical protein